ncbi:MAG: hypothetical protein QOI73_2239 [Solirubrobacteraceae bacterium]|nr:hypothetical protein [Solirubrobacteraceae bacterium]
MAGGATHANVRRRTLITAMAGLCLAAGTAGIAGAASSPAPKTASIKAVQTLKMKVNRYVQDGLRWDKDVYRVRSGGTLTVINNAPDEGPHTLSVVKASDLPKTAAQALGNCKICHVFEQAHGADPHSEGPPKFNYVENGVGQDTSPNLDRPGDSGLTGEGKKGEKITFKVTAKKGTHLRLLCILHPWMQARLDVG